MKFIKCVFAIVALISMGTTKVATDIKSCGPTIIYNYGATVYSIKDGDWYSPSTWSTGSVPTQNDIVTFSHNITSTKNIVITGKLISRGGSITFLGINENNFKGGGMDVIEGDIGLWVMGAGQLDLQGQEKTAWTNTVAGVPALATTFAVKDAKGWSPGDQVVIVPTNKDDIIGFEQRTIKSIDGLVITVNAAFTQSHPGVNGMWTPEVMNLTRSILISGTRAGKSHVFIRSTVPQIVKYVEFQYLGPRKNQKGDDAKEIVLGRYGLHLHDCMDGSIGSIIRGCSMHEVDNHCYVPHMSHGVKLIGNIAYNVTEAPIWWDPGPNNASHGNRVDSNCVGLVKFVPRSIDISIEDPDQPPSFAAAGFYLGAGDDDTCVNNVAVGIYGQDRTDGGGAYNWEANNETTPWVFKNNLAHNCNTGIRTWQNTSRNHIIEDFFSYYCTMGIFHGAYANNYQYTGGFHYASPTIIHAGGDEAMPAQLIFENITWDGGGVTPVSVTFEGSPVPSLLPILVRNCTSKNNTKYDYEHVGGNEKHDVDIVNCTGKAVDNAANATVRVLTIPGYGNGTGLQGTYSSSGKILFTRIDPSINFQEWKTYLHHTVSGDINVVWTGYLLPQYTETYTFSGVKITVDGKTGPVSLTAGKIVPVKVEFSGAPAPVVLMWQSKSQTKEVIQRSQLYPDAIVINPPPPVNIPPVVNAGADITIQLPVNSCSLTGSAKDVDGTIASYKWSKLAGPNQYNISNPDQQNAQASGLLEGTYIFRLQAADDKGAISYDEVNVIVKPAPVNQPPAVNVSVSVTVTKSGNIILVGTGTDPEGGQLTYQWRQSDSGQIRLNIIQDGKGKGQIFGAPAGDYKFILKVTDDKGASTEKEVSITI